MAALEAEAQHSVVCKAESQLWILRGLLVIAELSAAELCFLKSLCVVSQCVFSLSCFVITDSALPVSSLDIHSVFCKYACSTIGRYVISVFLSSHVYPQCSGLSLDMFAELSHSSVSRRNRLWEVDTAALVLMPGHSGQVGCGFGR